MADPGLGATGAEGGNFKGMQSGASSSSPVSAEAFNQLNAHIDKTKQKLGELKTELKSINQESERISANFQAMSNAAPSGGERNAVGGKTYQNLFSAFNKGEGGGMGGAAQGIRSLLGGGGAGGGGGTLARLGSAASAAAGPIAIGLIAAQIGGAIIHAMDSRIQQVAPNVLASDRVGMMIRPAAGGISQLQYQAQYRNPLQSFLIGGQQGTNDLLAMHATTGLDLNSLARGAEAGRILSGFGYTAQQSAQMFGQLAAPQTNNAMFMRFGVSMIGPGGQTNDPVRLMQMLSQRTGLTNDRIAQSAMMPGSNSRYVLAQAGISEEMQTQIIQYAQSNNAFRRMTGGSMGMYDPTNAAHRNVLGIEENYATEFERTEMTRSQRDEDLYRRQIDNFATLEERTQGVIRAFGSLEDKLSGLLGTAISTSPWRGVASNVLNSVPVIGPLANVLFSGIGDAVEGGSGGSSPASSAESRLSSHHGWSKLHGNMKQKLLRMFAANPRLTLTSGWRSSSSQHDLFVSRHTRTSEKTSKYYDGSYWKQKPGTPATAVPGSSMHEIGLAADIGPSSQYDWIVANASRFGLQVGTSFGEPWHVQPAELPMSRSRYEAQGAPWGLGADGGGPASRRTQGSYRPSADLRDVPDTGHNEGVGNFLPMVSGMSIKDVISAMSDLSRGRLLGMAYGEASGGSTSSVTKGSGRRSSAFVYKGGSLTGADVARLAASKGLRGEALARAIAIAYGESRFNPNAEGDISLQNDKWGPSLGLWQVRSLKAQTNTGGPRDASRLKDPNFNASSMMSISSNGSNWQPWSVFKSGTYAQYMGEARNSMREAGVGDAVPPARSLGGSTVVNNGGDVVIAPVFNISSSGPVNPEELATRVTSLIASSEAVKALRRS